jgi:hypothetical protein
MAVFDGRLTIHDATASLKVPEPARWFKRIYPASKSATDWWPDQRLPEDGPDLGSDEARSRFGMPIIRPLSLVSFP